MTMNRKKAILELTDKKPWQEKAGRPRESWLGVCNSILIAAADSEDYMSVYIIFSV